MWSRKNQTLNMKQKISPLPGKKSKAKFKRTALNVIPLLPQIARKEYTVHENVQGLPFTGETEKEREIRLLRKHLEGRRIVQKAHPQSSLHIYESRFILPI